MENRNYLAKRMTEEVTHVMTILEVTLVNNITVNGGLIIFEFEYISCNILENVQKKSGHW